MNLNAEAIGRRYAIRPGCRFLGYREVGIAVFAMNLRVLLVEPRLVPPIDEFLLRLLAEGVHPVGTLASLLGLDPELVKDRLIELRREELIDVIGLDERDGEECELTERGRLAANELKQSVMHEVTLPNVIFHGLLRRPVDLGQRARKQYLQPKEAKDAELALIRAIPNRYPRSEEIDISQLDRILKLGPRARTGANRDAVAVKGVLKNVHTLYEPAVMLEYETVDGEHDRQVAFAVEGRLLEEYESAFAKAKGPSLLRDILHPAEESIGERVRRQATVEVVHRLGNFDDAELLASQVAEARQRVEDAKAELEATSRPDTKQVLRDRIGKLEAKVSEVMQERESRKVKYLWTPEIREKLLEAIQTAEARLLILSGWISSEVVNNDFIQGLRQAIKRGVRIWIGYGFDKGSRSGEEQRARSSWQDAEKALRNLQKELPNALTFKDIGYTHEKRLICDDRFTFGGSFNLLSFSGERRGRGRLRHEGADLIQDPQFCDELFERFVRQFFT